MEGEYRACGGAASQTVARSSVLDVDPKTPGRPRSRLTHARYDQKKRNNYQSDCDLKRVLSLIFPRYDGVEMTTSVRRHRRDEKDGESCSFRSEIKTHSLDKR